MSKLANAQSELLEMDAMAAGSSPIHTLHPVAKLLTTIFYIYTVVSFPKYDLSGLTVMILYPVILYQIAGIRISDCFYRLRMVLPLVRVVIQHFSKNTVISMVLGHPNSEITCIPPS